MGSPPETEIDPPAPTDDDPRPARLGAGAIFGGLAQRTARVGLGVLAGVVVGLLAWGIVSVLGSTSHHARQPRSATQPVAPPKPHPSTALVVPAGDSLVAEARVGRVAVYASAVAKRPKQKLSNPNADRAPLVFLVAAVRPHRLRVLLPTRPNLSQGWIARSDVRLVLNQYRVAVHLKAHSMMIWRSGRLIQRYPVGVGQRAVTPTPFGLYYITELLKQPNPNGVYGPYAFGLSAHSDVLHEFAGGNGEIGIHGTDEPSAIGKNVSHGCIRVENRVIRRLAHELPLGAPVQIER